jgi:hypothetical protein
MGAVGGEVRVIQVGARVGLDFILGVGVCLVGWCGKECSDGGVGCGGVGAGWRVARLGPFYV